MRLHLGRESGHDRRVRWLTNRISHLHEAFLTPLWAWGWTIALGLVSGLAWLRDEFWSADLAARYRFVNFLPHWSLAWWVVAWVTALWFVLFEGSFRRVRELKRERDLAAETADVYFKAIQASMGDVPIEHVFHWINLAEPEEKAWDEIGDDLRDRLHLGQISVWGRPLSAMGKPGALTEIKAMHWSTMRFSYRFLLDDKDGAKHSQHTWNPQGGTEYTGLVFNADQIEALWPPPNRPTGASWLPWRKGTG